MFELNRHTKEMPTRINQIGDERIKPVKVVKNLGILRDMQLYMGLYITTRIFEFCITGNNTTKM